MNGRTTTKSTGERNRSWGKVTVWAAVALALGLIAGCNGADEVVGPSDCEVRDTADITLKNGSSNATYDAVVDGARVATLGPGKTFTMTVTARQTHPVVFRHASTGATACSTATPSLPMCTTHTLSCDAGQAFRGITVLNSTAYSAVAIDLGGRRFDIARNQNLAISMTQASVRMSLWECPQGSACRWDSVYTAVDNHAYVIQQTPGAASGDMRIVDFGVRN